MLRALDEDKLRMIALISCLIQTILFFVENFYFPTFLSTANIIYNPSSLFEIIMMAIGIFNLFIGFLIGFYLFVKKLPILWHLTSKLE